MANKGTLLRYLACSIVFVKYAEAMNCFSGTCNKGDGLVHCTSGHWQCRHQEFCDVIVHHDSSISMVCSDLHHSLPRCQDAMNHNDHTCHPLQYPPQHNCVYCCESEQCVHDIVASGSVPGHAESIPGHLQSCFTSFCDHHTHLDSCLNGTWHCAADEYCRFEAHKNGDIIMHCENSLHQMNKCIQDSTHNQPACSPLAVSPPFSDCTYCCQTEACIRSMVQAPPSTTTTTTTTTITTTPAPPLNLLPGRESCFTTDCPHHTDLPHCAAGSYACSPYQICSVHMNANGDVHMKCDDRVQDCQIHAIHNPHACDLRPLPYPPPHNCLYCCADEACVFSILSAPATSAPATATPTTAAPTTAAPTTAAPTTAAPIVTSQPTTIAPAGGCVDVMDTLRCQLFANCSLSDHALVCAKTCNQCTGMTSTAAAATAATAAATTTTAAPATAAAATTTAALTTAAAATTTAAAPISAATTAAHTTAAATTTTTTAPPTAAASPTTAAPTTAAAATTKTTTTTAPPTAATTAAPTTTAAAATTAAPTTALPTTAAHTTAAHTPPAHTTAAVNSATISGADVSTATAAALRNCVQCGDYDSGTPCDNAQLFHNDVTPCPGLDAPFCMTDVVINAQSDLSISKRCVNQTVCQVKWYDQTSDKHACLVFDPSSPPPLMTCHYCCTSDGCNTDIIPDYNSRWRP